jgi:hypothetical protein
LLQLNDDLKLPTFRTRGQRPILWIQVRTIGFLAVRRAHDIQNPRACPHVSKGGPFVGTCTQCGRRGLTIKAMSEECENVRGLTQGEAVLEAMPGNTSCYPRAAHCCTKATYAKAARNRCWRPGSPIPPKSLPAAHAVALPARSCGLPGYLAQAVAIEGRT